MGQEADNGCFRCDSHMIGRLNHIALVVPDLSTSAAQYRDLLGADVSDPQRLEEHGVEVIFINVSNTKIELLHPLDEESPIYNFLQKHPTGGMHHICYEVDDIEQSKHHLESQGAKVLGDIKIGAHGKPVIFLDPRDFSGVLIELEQS